MTPAASLACVRCVHSSGVVALDQVSLDVLPGEHVAVVGASGSGKTTLLRCLAGELSPTEGVAVPALRPGIIFQDHLLVGRSSVLKNVLHGAARRKGESKAALREEAMEVLGKLGLRHRAEFRVNQLSGGEQQRVALARALMSQPTLILADEPVASLDPASARTALGLLRKVCAQENLGLISVLHDQGLAREYADRIVFLQRGQICAHPDPAAACADCGLCASEAAEPAKPPKKVSPILTAAGWAAAALVLAWSLWMAGMHKVDWAGAAASSPRFLSGLAPSPDQLREISWLGLGGSLLATLAMAIAGTALAWVVCIPLSVAAARNVSPAWVRLPMRALLNMIRSVPSILWALLAVAAFGLGPGPGVLALAAYSTGYLTKFFYEAFESIDPRTSNALKTYGMNGFQAFRAAVWPSAQPAVLSHSLFMLEYNFRTAGVLGVVGAGGIGHDLRMAVDWANWHVVGVIMVIMAVSVLLFDALSSRLRERLV